MDTSSVKDRWVKAVTTALISLLALSAFLSFNISQIRAQEGKLDHPFIEPKDIKSETCLTCHPDKKDGKFVHTAVGMGCENCHQAASENGKTTVTPVATGGELCAMCHEAKKDPVVHGPYKAGQCLVCHNPHSSDFPRQTRAVTDTLCMSCHSASRPDVKVNAEAKKVALLGGRTFDLASYEKAPKIDAGHSESNKSPPASHPVSGQDPRKPDTELNCISCHNPHASKAEHLLHKATQSREAAENLCLGCHGDISAQVKKPVQHAAVDMGCGTCHSPHKSAPAASPQDTFYLTSAQPDLCLACHDAKDGTIQKAHLGQPFGTSRCSECHNPHGSDRPKLINNFVHPPFADKQCDTCHNAPHEGKVDVNEGGKRALCYMCHDGIQKQVEFAKSRHAVFEVTETCTGCHSPHASREPKLLQAPQGRVCASCHEMSTEPVRHGPYDRGQCADCHDPHGAEEPRLLRAKRNDLCRACHVLGQPGVKVEAETVTLAWKLVLAKMEYQAAPKIGLDRDGEHGHPLVGHPTSGKNTKGTGDITCRSCHQPHSSKIANLMPPKVKDDIELCELCHK